MDTNSMKVDDIELDNWKPDESSSVIVSASEKDVSGTHNPLIVLPINQTDLNRINLRGSRNTIRNMKIFFYPGVFILSCIILIILFRFEGADLERIGKSAVLMRLFNQTMRC